MSNNIVCQGLRGRRSELRTETRTVSFDSDHEYWDRIGGTIDAFIEEMSERAAREQEETSARNGEECPPSVPMQIHVDSMGPSESEDGRPRAELRMHWRIDLGPAEAFTTVPNERSSAGRGPRRTPRRRRATR